MDIVSSPLQPHIGGRTGVRYTPSTAPLLTYSYYLVNPVNAARKSHPELPAGNETYDRSKQTFEVTFKTDRFERILGLKYYTMEETSQAILENFQERGFWDGKPPQA